MRCVFLTMKTLIFCCILPILSIAQYRFSDFFSDVVPLNQELLLEKEAGKSKHLFLNEQYHSIPKIAYDHFRLSSIFNNAPDSISVIGGFEEEESNYGWLLLASWKNGKSQEVAVSYSIRTGQPQTHLWLVDPFENKTAEENAVIYAESGANFYIEFSATTYESEPIKKYYSFNEDTGLFDLSE